MKEVTVPFAFAAAFFASLDSTEGSGKFKVFGVLIDGSVDDFKISPRSIFQKKSTKWGCFTSLVILRNQCLMSYSKFESFSKKLQSSY